MAQILPLKLESDGLPIEVDSAADDITFASYTVNGGAVLSATGLDMNDTSISDAAGLAFNDPATDGVTTTAGLVPADNLMSEIFDNILTTAASIQFPVISDAAGEVDAFRLPSLAGAPTATPANGGEGHLMWDSTNDKLYAWNGSAWDDLSTVTSAQNLDDDFTAGEDLTALDVVYISAADTVSIADNTALATARAIGIAQASVLTGASVSVRSNGTVSGFPAATFGSVGAPVFLDASGGVTQTVPIGAGRRIVRLGYARSDTSLFLDVDAIGVRA